MISYLTTVWRKVVKQEENLQKPSARLPGRVRDAVKKGFRS